MSSLKNNINLTHSTLTNEFRDSLHVNGYHGYPPRSRTPNGLSTPVNHPHIGTAAESELGADEDPKISVFKEIFMRSEARLGALFGNDGGIIKRDVIRTEEQIVQVEEGTEEVQEPVASSQKKNTRAIDEDDYDESDGEDEDGSATASPLKLKGLTNSNIPILSPSIMLRGTPSSSAPTSVKGSSSGQVKTSEDVRKKLEEDKKAIEDATKRSFHTSFHTVDNDMDAMLDQKKLEESDLQVDVEMNGNGASHSHANSSSGNAQQGTLSQTNLGASSLTLKHLIARIDAKRDQVRASDAELRTLMSEVRKNRSKWASPEKIGQEELYEAAEKVLSELKAMTEHSTAFLTRVNKREAPDYYNGMNHPTHNLLTLANVSRPSDQTSNGPRQYDQET